MAWSRWRESQHPDHPAMAIIDDLSRAARRLLDYPRQVALLLPLTGRTARAGQAIQNGFLGAYFAAAGGLDDRQTMRVYDVNRKAAPVPRTSRRRRRRGVRRRSPCCATTSPNWPTTSWFRCRS